MRGLVLTLGLAMLAAPAVAQQATPNDLAPAPVAEPTAMTPAPAPKSASRKAARIKASLLAQPMQLLKFVAANGKQPPNAAGATLDRPSRHKPNPAPPGTYDALILSHAQANGIPEALIHRVIKRESRYDPAAIGRGGAMGLMQIKPATARSVGYDGPPTGLLDPATNLTYAVRYLAGAFRAANGNTERAYAYFRTGYFKSRRTGSVVSPRESRNQSREASALPPSAEATPSVAPAPPATPGGALSLRGPQ
jgi:soluble lytic murein transglycosylase-like protein